jgi:hypothetical protein
VTSNLVDFPPDSLVAFDLENVDPSWTESVFRSLLMNSGAYSRLGSLWNVSHPVLRSR